MGLVRVTDSVLGLGGASAGEAEHHVIRRNATWTTDTNRTLPCAHRARRCLKDPDNDIFPRSQALRPLSELIMSQHAEMRRDIYRL